MTGRKSKPRVVVVLPAYNAASTLLDTIREIDRSVVDHILLVDDASQDQTADIAENLGLQTIRHPYNRGYGGNQKTCYNAALDTDADIVVMVHPDYQYTPKLIPALAALIESGLYEIALGSRILGKGALKGGMPLYKYISNRLLTAFQNIMLGEKLSEYHTGYRAFTRQVLEQLPLEENSDGFLFDNQMLAQILWRNVTIAEVSCPTKYFPEASSINFRRSVRYGIGCLWTGLCFRLARAGLLRSRLFQ